MRAFICGLKGHALEPEERSFLKETSPWGIILFRRNIETRDQVASLTSEIRQVLGRQTPILVDQEGGRVQRLTAPHWKSYPCAAKFLNVTPNLENAMRLAWLGARLMAYDLREVGIDVDCLPVLDIPTQGAHEIISDRAYARDCQQVKRLGRAAAEGLMTGGVAPVMKHIPGHGRALADSHLELPTVSASLAELESLDFVSFRANADLPMAMTAHVVYAAIDPEKPGTLSKTIIEEIIRKNIGFRGLLMTDDLSMKALSGDFRSRAEQAIAAGCDIVLHCNGDLEEARCVAEGAPLLRDKSAHRAERALDVITRIAPFDVSKALAEFDAAFLGS
ncbi:beta-hexosaminidase [Methylocystaceae bacterium]|nr:beta-hexosaminidase [Methylocystaceae bacterium]